MHYLPNIVINMFLFSHPKTLKDVSPGGITTQNTEWSRPEKIRDQKRQASRLWSKNERQFLRKSFKLSIKTFIKSSRNFLLINQKIFYYQTVLSASKSYSFYPVETSARHCSACTCTPKHGWFNSVNFEPTFYFSILSVRWPAA